jgi:hypothetical protein
MKHLFIYLFLIGMLVSCNDNYSNKIELSGSDGNYQIVIYNEPLCWQSGDENKVIPCSIGSSEKFIWKKLKGKGGKCNIFYNRICVDKYGNKSSEDLYYKTIDLDEMNRFQEIGYWRHNSSGAWCSRTFPACPN